MLTNSLNFNGCPLIFHCRLRQVSEMAPIQGANLSSTISTLSNGTDQESKIYVFTPVGSSTKLTLLIFFVTVGTIGFVGSILILCFLKAKKKTNHILKSLSFEKNSDFYINSLAISDIFSNLISLPCLCVQMYFDVFQDGWGCKIFRYLQFTFPCVTMNNLLVISIERYFSIRKNPRPFPHAAVRKLVLFAWLAGIVLVLLPVSTLKGVRYDVNETHYTTFCTFDSNFLPSRIILLIGTTFQYIIPSFIIIVISVCLITTVRTTTGRTINVQQDNAIKAMARAAKRRATIIIVALMFAFIIPYLGVFVATSFSAITKRDIVYDSQTYYIIRYTNMIVALSNGAVNFIIYLVQMKDFRAFLRNQFLSRIRADNVNSREVVNAQIEVQ